MCHPAQLRIARNDETYSKKDCLMKGKLFTENPAQCEVFEEDECDPGRLWPDVTTSTSKSHEENNESLLYQNRAHKKKWMLEISELNRACHSAFQ